MATSLAVSRIQQKAVQALTAFFNGHIKAVLVPIDVVKLTFGANVTVNAGTANEKTYTPCDDNGKIKTFANIDDLVTWLKSAYTDILTLDLSVADFSLISKVSVVATDILKDATTKKAVFTKLKLGLVDNLAAAQLDLTRATTAGYNNPASPAYSLGAQAIYDEYVAKQTSIQAASDFYAARIVYFQTIITG